MSFVTKRGKTSWFRGIVRSFSVPRVIYPTGGHCKLRTMSDKVPPGNRQSPIDISTRNVVKGSNLLPLSALKWNTPANGTLENNGYSLHFHPHEKSASLRNHLGSYTVQQFHFHWGRNDSEGSEHHVDGKKYAAEIHFVATKDGEANKTVPDYCTVIGVFCEADPSVASSENPWNKIKVDALVDSLDKVDVQNIVMEEFLPVSLDYFHYEGSLTTPNYDEIVQWFVLRNPIKIPSPYLQQLRSLKDPRKNDITANFRDLQTLHGRSVSVYP